MSRYLVSGKRVLALAESGPTLADAVAAYREANPGCVPDYWEKDDGAEDGIVTEGGAIIGICEGCEKPIVEGLAYAVDEDGIMECPDCVHPDDREHCHP